MNKKIITTLLLLTIPVAALAFNSGTTPNVAPGLVISDLIDVVFAFNCALVVVLLNCFFGGVGREQ
jgi:hypothetical protein